MISAVIAQLEKLKDTEGDIPVMIEGFFGEVLAPKFHVKCTATNRNGLHCPVIDGENTNRGEKVLQVDHL